VSKHAEIAPEDCPEPWWHETHLYCPVCTWTESQGKPATPEEAALQAVGRLSGTPMYANTTLCPDVAGAIAPLLAEVERLRGVVAIGRELENCEPYLGSYTLDMLDMYHGIMERFRAALADLEAKP